MKKKQYIKPELSEVLLDAQVSLSTASEGSPALPKEGEDFDIAPDTEDTDEDPVTD